MTNTLRLLALIALAFSITACAGAPKKSDCCDTKKCPPGSAQCQACPVKKKAN